MLPSIARGVALHCGPALRSQVGAVSRAGAIIGNGLNTRRTLPNINANPSARLLQRRDITVGKDGWNFSTVILMVPQAEEWMIERFGKFHRIAQPGFDVAIPLIESVAYKRSLKETTIDIHPQQAITKDNVHVKLNGSVYAQVEDAYKASYEIEAPEYMIATLAQSAMRKEVGNLELDELFEEREKLNAGIAKALDEASAPWGIRVFRYEIANIDVDAVTKAAMEKQSNAERLRRAEVLESQGYRQRLINQSEGESRSEINRAQGEAESLRLRAQAEADQIRMVAEAEAERTRLTAQAAADGIRAIAEAVNKPGGKDAVSQRLAELYISAIPEIAKQANLVVVPDKPNDVGGVVATAMSIAKTIDVVADVNTDGKKSCS